MRNWNYALVKMMDRFPEQAESDLTYLVDQQNGDRMIKQLLNSLSQNIMICQCLAEQIFTSAFAFGK